jgi:Zn-dependent alcohol dehydrogenase
LAANGNGVVMKAVVVKKIGSFALEDVGIPEPGCGEVLIETAVTGLCRTDLKIIEVGLPTIWNNGFTCILEQAVAHVRPASKVRKTCVMR